MVNLSYPLYEDAHVSSVFSQSRTAIVAPCGREPTGQVLCSSIEDASVSCFK
jgi:hypothetical protein